ncbi:unnamed protein product [Brassicogethes aeneus]|uniref:Lipase n=1 Tax=Brassicogethes aeneus TaxID=1431903 RepID=A0A9P0B2A7_BRAAE|nr:unnamed protein product [Brassicogethes aeneus]
MKFNLTFLLCLNIGYVCSNLLEPHPDLDLTIEQVLTKYGYPFEVHDIETEDGYLLTTYRIPHGKNSTKIGTPILFVPGTGGTAENFLILGNDSAIAYYLADKGYDIWLMNQRGTTHSRRHKTLNPATDTKYWDFDWHEVGVYDIPANVDHLLNVTKKEKFIYIGHSQGTTTYFVFTSERPEYNNKIIVGIQFGVAVYLKNLHVPMLDFLGKYHRIIEGILRILNIHYIIPDNEEMLDAIKQFCGLTPASADVCGKALALLGSDDIKNLNFNNSFTPIIFRDSPAGASIKQMLHYFQMIDSGEFRQYDHGTTGNLKRYGQTEPPNYDLTKCLAPVAIFQGRGDFETTDETRDRLLSQLPNVVYYHVVAYEHFHHADFIWGNDVPELINKPVYRLLKRLKKLRYF